MKRIFAVLAVMAAMMVASALPALAKTQNCMDYAATSQTGPGQGNTFGQLVSEQVKEFQPAGQTLVKPLAQGEITCPS